MILVTLFAVFGAAFVAATALMPAVRAAALHVGAIDRPGRRRLHREITPRLGGIAVYAGALVGLMVGVVVPSAIHPAGVEQVFLAIVLTSMGIVLIGLIDDARGLKAPHKLLAEVALAIVLFKAGLRIEQLELPVVGAWTLGEVTSLVATVLWMVAVTNGFNLIDGVNGLAGGVAGVTAAGLIVLGLLVDSPVVVVLAAAVAGATLAFLRHNLRPGGIFLGDSGSLYLGLLLAAATVHLGQSAERAIFPGAGLLLMGLPLVEVGTTVIRRTRHSRLLKRGPGGTLRFIRRELLHADAGHLHHCLIRRGLRAGAASALLIGAAAVYCLASVSFFAVPEAGAPAYLLATAATVACLGICRPFAPRSSWPTAAPAPMPDLRVIPGGRVAAGEREIAGENMAAGEEAEADDERVAA